MKRLMGYRMGCIGLVALLCCAAAGHAQDVREFGDAGEARWLNPYLALSVSFNYFPETDLRSSDPGVDESFRLTRATASFEVREGLIAALGTATPWGLRVEVEYSFRSVGFDRGRLVNISRGNAVGRGNINAAMANVAYDFDLFDWPVRPYIGGGAGVAFHRGALRRIGFFPLNLRGGRDTSFAWQAMAGISHTITPDTDLYVGYRYFHAGRVDYGDTRVTLSAHSIEAGFRIRF